MSQEEQAQKSNISGINVIGRSSGKKPKEKKIPQRGLGVAQLEKIRLEEQQKRVSDYHNHSNQSSSSSSLVSFLSPPENIDATRPNSDIPADFNASKLWNSCYDHLNLHQEFNPIWPHLSHHPIPSTVNVQVPVTPSSLSPMSSYQMELPSNQSYHGNYSLIYPDEEIKMLGNKRLYTFVDTDQPGSSSNSKFITIADPTRGDELFSSDNRASINSEHKCSSSRELGPPCSTPIPEPNAMKNLIDNTDFHGSFLTLSLPTTTTKASPSSSFDLHSFVDSKIPDFDTTPFQGTKFQDEQSKSSQDMHFYSFFPPAKRHVCESSEATKHCCPSGDDDQNVDLNLKL